MRRHPAFLVLLLVLIPAAQAQQVTVSGDRGGLRARLTALVDGLDARGRATSLLHSRVPSRVALAAFDGSASAPPVTVREWRQAYFELYHSFDGTPSWPEPRAVGGGASPLALGVLDVAYDAIRPDALERGLLAVEGGRLVDRSGGEPLYVTRRAFAVAPVGHGRLRAGREYALSFAAARYFGDALPAAFDVDAGSGPRRVRPGEVFTLRFDAPGRHRVAVTAHTAGGPRHAAFFVDVAPAAPVPDIRWDDLVADIPYAGGFASYDACIYLGAGNADIDRPLILAEGFDFDNSLDCDAIFDLVSQEGLTDRLLADGYDLVIQNYNDATTYVQRNAFALVHLIEKLNAEKVGTEPLVVTGASMGGVIARYALAYMEANGLDHQTRLYASFDSPHQTANIPLGVQFWVEFFSEFDAEAQTFLAALDAPAARQLLVYHHTATPDPTTDPDRAVLFQELADLGNYPALPRKIAIANGSGDGPDAPQLGTFAPMNPGDKIVDWAYDVFLLVEVDGDVWAVPDVSPQTQIFEGYLEVLLIPLGSLDVFASDTLPYDNAPGGRRGSQGDIADVDPVFEFIGIDISLGDIKTDFPDHDFIPTGSALDVRDGAGAPLDLFADLNALADLTGMTPFDAVYLAPTTANEEHVQVTPGNADFFVEQVNLGTSPVTVTLTPAVDPVIIPPEGGTFDFTLTATNTTATAQTVDLSILIGTPGGGTIGPVLQRTVTLAPEGALVRGARQKIPGGAPAGTYTYTLYAVAAGDTLDSDGFSFTKSAVAPGARVGVWPAAEVADAAVLAGAATVPAAFDLAPVYPNPFNPSTTIRYTLAAGGAVRLAVYDVLGREVAVLADGRQAAGPHAVQWAAGALPGGVYFVRLATPGGVRTTRAVLLK